MTSEKVAGVGLDSAIQIIPGERHGAGRHQINAPFLGERLVTYKVPRTIEYVDVPLRDDAGKVRRSALRAERIES